LLFEGAVFNLDMTELIIFTVVVIAVVLLTRLLGAWMLRINDVIKLLKQINDKLIDKNIQECLSCHGTGRLLKNEKAVTCNYCNGLGVCKSPLK